MNRILAALSLGMAIGFGVGSSASAQQPIKIGFVGTFSGSGAAFGEDMYAAFMLPIERNGGKLGGVPVQVIRKDSQFKPEVANQVTDELLDRENVSIIAGVTFSNEMLAIYQKVVGRGVYIIGSNAARPSWRVRSVLPCISTRTLKTTNAPRRPAST